ncbi:hypothetical protein [Pectinatus frisingensis]|uniref:hypothetical protein n=1 Tax=Pectinatus frisingensis TaxID=865 RepID=UPI003D8013F9
MLLNILQGFIICQVILTSLIFIYEFFSPVLKIYKTDRKFSISEYKNELRAFCKNNSKLDKFDTKLNIVFFISTFFYSVLMNYYDLAIVSSLLGIFLFWFDKKNNSRGKINE